MPSGNPRFGETWTTADSMTGRDVPGVIASVTDTIVTFVGRSGNRARVPLGRLDLTWRYRQPAPTGNYPSCARADCLNLGFLRYEYERQNIYTCPRHLPLGIQSSVILTPQEGEQAQREGPFFERVVHHMPCPGCRDQNPIEEGRYTPSPNWNFWLCSQCNHHWVTLNKDVNYAPQLRTVLSEVQNRLVTTVSIVVGALAWQRFSQQIYGGLDQGENPQFASTRVRRLTGEENEIWQQEVYLDLRGDPVIMGVVPPAPRIGQLLRPIQRLGGQPDRGPGSSLRRVEIAPIPVHRPSATASEEPEEAESSSLTSIANKSLWSNKRNGQLFEVIRVEDIDKQTRMVEFKAFGDDQDARAVRMIWKDFLRYHRPYEEMPVLKEPKIAPVEVCVGEEWESINGDIVSIANVDMRTETVFAFDQNGKNRKAIKLSEFQKAAWRKIVRKSSFDRLLEDDGEDLF